MQAQNNISAKTMILPQGAYTPVFFATLVLLVLMQPSLAAIDSAMGNALCTIVQIVYGNLGRGIATIAVIVIGIGATLGKASWGMALTVATGIAVIFNATGIVNTLGVGAGC